MNTPDGKFKQDASGLFHYEYTGLVGDVAAAAKDALEYRQSPAWFWFNGTPAPIHALDNAAILTERWEFWRRGIENGQLLFLLRCLANTR